MPLKQIPAYISAAVADPGRPAEDKQRDEIASRPKRWQFAGVKPGDKVVRSSFPATVTSRAS